MDNFCSNCGKELNKEARFCNNCGQAVTNTKTVTQQQTSTYTVNGIKTPLNSGESIIVQQTATSFNCMPRISGKMILTNQRIIWEKGGIMNIVGMGVLSLAGDKHICVPLKEISSIKSTTILGASGLEFSTKTMGTFKFSLNGLNQKQSRDIIIDYVNKHI